MRNNKIVIKQHFDDSSQLNLIMMIGSHQNFVRFLKYLKLKIYICLTKQSLSSTTLHTFVHEWLVSSV